MSTPLVINPYAFVSEPIRYRDDAFIDVMAPKPAGSLQKRRISRTDDPDLYTELLRISRREEPPAAIGQRGSLRELGILVRKSDTPTWPRYSCSWPLRGTRPIDCGSAFPPAVMQLLANPVYFARLPDVAIRDAATGLVFPHWFSDIASASPARDGSRSFVRTSRRKLRQHGFMTMAGIIPPPHLRSLRRYCRSLVAGGFLELDERQGRLWRHGDGVASVFHHLLTPLLSDLTGESLKPSYTFLSAFRRGGILPKHTDRAQCEYTASLLVDFEPRSHDLFQWPITLELPPASSRRCVTIRQKIGDLLVFRGRELPHHRPRLRVGNAIHLLFHYVRADFRGPLR